jgi:glycine/D-amino acid oxidase-like deaminating enzyme
MTFSLISCDDGGSTDRTPRLIRPPLGQGPAETDRAIEAIRLWLRWDEAAERLTEELYRLGPRHADVENAMDQVEQLRLRAKTISEEIQRYYQTR